MAAFAFVALMMLWTIVWLGIGPWFRRSLARRRPPGAPLGSQAMRVPAAYEVAVDEALRDGVVTEEERVHLLRLRAALGLSPADHARTVARLRGPKDPEARGPVDS